jgi:hypothetical protein
VARNLLFDFIDNRRRLLRIMVYRPRGVPNSRIKNQTGITITAPSRK